MLDEILQTRIMVKQAMKATKEGEALQRLMNARQMGLKLIANVTYGYTSATFSGRMPCVDIADSIVQQARETLTRAMRMVESHAAWNAKVRVGQRSGRMLRVYRAAGHVKAAAVNLRVRLLWPKPPPLTFSPTFLLSAFF